MPNIKGDDGALKTIFSNSKIIAVVGHSEKSNRASSQGAKFLHAVGYRVYPGNPMVKQIDGQSCYPSLEDIPEPVDIFNVYRHPDYLPEIVESAIASQAATLWTQLKINHPVAEKKSDRGGFKCDYGCLYPDRISAFISLKQNPTMGGVSGLI